MHKYNAIRCLMVTLNRDKVKQVIASVDWGYTNPGVLQVWAIDGDGRMYLVHQIYRSGRLIGWWVEQAVELWQHFGISVFVCDPAEPQYIMAFREAGLNAVAGFNSIAPGIQAVQERLPESGDGKPRMFFLEGSLVERDESIPATKPHSTEDEFAVYVWPKGADGKSMKEVPTKANDHGMDTMRYAVCYADGLGEREVEPDIIMISTSGLWGS